MKKRIVSLALVLVMVVALFAGCGSDSPEGTWKIKTVDDKDASAYIQMLVGFAAAFAGDEVDAEELAKKMEDSMGFTLKADGVATGIEMDEEFNTKEIQGTWKLDGEKITITVGKTTMEGTLKDGQITVTKDGHTMVLVKK
ncbi:MAG: lipocalin family protein [Oscillospiraceae bacterium]|nr:lipocalin family protein [Oscillospiraceae bacterium]